MADSFLFRALGLRYIKVSPEDIESHTMNFKFGMPVLLSAYPSSTAYNRFSYDMMPQLNTARYRLNMLRSYLPSNIFFRKQYLNKVREEVPANLRAEVVDAFDQDYAMILGEGTRAGIFQSIMMKPPNVQPVYPLHAELPEKKTVIKIDGAGAKHGPVIVFNLELQDPRGLLAVRGHKYFYRILRQLSRLNGDYDIVLLVAKTNMGTVQRYVKTLGKFADSVQIIETSDSYHIGLDKDTEAAIKHAGRQLVWLSQCTQQNFFTAFEKLGAAFIGYANEDFSHTQTFNCHKVNQFKVGVAL